MSWRPNVFPLCLESNKATCSSQLCLSFFFVNDLAQLIKPSYLGVQLDDTTLGILLYTDEKVLLPPLRKELNAVFKEADLPHIYLETSYDVNMIEHNLKLSYKDKWSTDTMAKNHNSEPPTRSDQNLMSPFTLCAQLRTVHARVKIKTWGRRNCP